MEKYIRPDPDMLLSRIQKAGFKKAGFKIFFGMAAGVGKTYTMLKEARLLIERGEDVVIGWLESHGRKETDSLAANIEIIPRKSVVYRDINLYDMDLEAILARKPAVVLVDELAHSNTPGLKHPKRYQDVLDILDAGIDVYTTVNIQHLESISDVVEELTGVRISERVPDSVFDRADEIQLIDIPPEELLQRLDEGKVYLGNKSRDAVSNFFKKENLALLRELALKHAAQLASHQLSSMLRGETSSLSSFENRDILVAVTSSPNSEYIIRWARRFAYNLKANWACIHVETGSSLSETDKENLTRNLTLARNLGARVVTLPGDDAVKVIIEYANKNNVSIIIAGKSGIMKNFSFFINRPCFSERLTRESGKISVIAVQEKKTQEAITTKLQTKITQFPRWQYMAVLAAVIIITLLNFMITPFMGYLSASIVYMAGIISMSMIVERIPIIIMSCLSALAWDFLFMPPRYTFIIHKGEDILILLLFLLIAVTSGWMTHRLKANERMLKIREQRMNLINELASILESSNTPENTALAGVEYIKRAFCEEAVVFLRKEEDSGLSDFPVNPCGFLQDEKEISAARFCFNSGTATGRFTNTLPTSLYHYVPMAAPGNTIGVIGIKSVNLKSWTTDQESFLLTLASTISLAVQREILYERNRQNLLLQESERLSRILLHSVSHELRTPLTIIQGSASALLDSDTASDKKVRELLLNDIISGTERLNRIIESLLAMNRLESGRLNLKLAQADVDELICLSLKQIQKESGDREILVNKPDNLPLVSCDIVLIIQVIVNLLQNAVTYSYAGAPIEINVKARKDEILFAVKDRGPGVKESDIPRLFEKFFRGENAGSKGTGLGLSICKGIIMAHKGTIAARQENGLNKGFVIEFSLPIDLTASNKDKI